MKCMLNRGLFGLPAPTHEIHAKQGFIWTLSISSMASLPNSALQLLKSNHRKYFLKSLFLIDNRVLS